MVYQNKFVVAIKVNGHILRESGDRVTLPFGSEYSVFIKNLNAVRAKFKLSIDGTDATSGTWIVVGANSSVEMERFIHDHNWASGNRFKFIERTAEIEQHRGVQVDDGLVRVEYQTEVVRQIVPVPEYVPYDVPVPYYPYPHPWYPPRYPRPRFFGSLQATGRSLRPSGMTANYSAHVTNSADSPTLDSCSVDVGITVPGSISQQQFVAVSDFKTGASEVIVLHLRGQIAGASVSQPVTVQTRLTCQTCGRTSKTGQFCANCGTALVVV